nr:hypothetical protein [uncultured Campylobacter sp.]
MRKFKSLAFLNLKNRVENSTSRLQIASGLEAPAEIKFHQILPLRAAAIKFHPCKAGGACRPNYL